MLMHKLALATALAIVGLGTVVSTPASAGVAVDVRIGLPLYAPPPPIVERVVVRPGRVWIPGYWRWGGARYVWIGGYWTHPRPGYRWYPPRWTGCGPHWCYHRGYWAR